MTGYLAYEASQAINRELRRQAAAQRRALALKAARAEPAPPAKRPRRRALIPRLRFRPSRAT
jgi:hypothetical protein